MGAYVLPPHGECFPFAKQSERRNLDKMTVVSAENLSRVVVAYAEKGDQCFSFKLRCYRFEFSTSLEDLNRLNIP